MLRIQAYVQLNLGSRGCFPSETCCRSACLQPQAGLFQQERFGCPSPQQSLDKAAVRHSATPVQRLVRCLQVRPPQGPGVALVRGDGPGCTQHTSARQPCPCMDWVLHVTIATSSSANVANGENLVGEWVALSDGSREMTSNS